MTMPDDRVHPDVSPVSQVSADAWEQHGAVGGQDPQGRLPAYAEAVAVTGIVQVREVPTLAAVAQAVALTAGAPLRVTGRTPQRRFIILSSNVDIYVGTEENNLRATQPVGLRVPADTLFSTAAAVEIWVVTGDSDGVVTFWSELDRG